MNILFFLKPKQDVVFLNSDLTLRQAMEIMEIHQYSSIPILDFNGKYVGTMTEGDLLWGMKALGGVSVKQAEDIQMMQIKRRMDYQIVRADSDMEDLIGKAMDQNFVPVEDDQGNFIGIITRRDIIDYCYTKIKEYERDT